MNQTSSSGIKSLNLNNIPEELIFSQERHTRVTRFIDEYLHAADHQMEETAYDALSLEDKQIVDKWALRIYNRALEIAPYITEVLRQMVGVDAELYGYTTLSGEVLVANGITKNTVKSVDSLRRKIITDAIIDYDDDFEMAGKNIRDGIRYTIIVSPDNYLEKVDEYLHYLEDMGYGPIDAKNHWIDAETFWNIQNKANWGNVRCQGINAKIVCPNGEDVFEIQFHTPMEHQIKEGSTRDLYNVLRDKRFAQDEDIETRKINRAFKAELEKYRMFLQATIIPPDTKDLKACDYEFVSKAKRR